MRILVDIGHPAHVHLFKNFIKEMKKRGHETIVTIKESFLVKYLLKKYGIKYINLGKKGAGLKGKFFKQFWFDFKILYYLYKYNIDLAVGTSISISHACLFHKSKSFIFNEDDIQSAPFFAKWAYPCANKIITPSSIGENYGKKHIQVDSLHELAYLHPDKFKPNKEIFKGAGLMEGEKYFVLRFNAFKAHHDRGINGLSFAMKKKLVVLLSRHGKVVITTEGDLDPIFKKYQMKISPEKIHDLIYFAQMFIGDSNSMCIEAAVLGTPSIRCNDFVGRCPVIEDLEHNYGLTYGFKPNKEEEILFKVNSLLTNKNLKKEWRKKKEEFLKDKIDLTLWMVGFVEKQR